METYDVVHVLLRHLRYLMKPTLLNRGLLFIRHQYGNVITMCGKKAAALQCKSYLCECMQQKHNRDGENEAVFHSATGRWWVVR